MSKPLLSIIVATKNDIEIIDKFFEGIKEQTIKDFEVIFICETSNDGTYESIIRFKNQYTGIKIRIYFIGNDLFYPNIRNGLVFRVFEIENDTINRITYGLRKLMCRKVAPYKDYKEPNYQMCFNEGIRRIKGKYFIYIRPNIILDSKFIEKCVLPLQEDEDLGLCISHLKEEDSCIRVEKPPLYASGQIIPPIKGVQDFINGTHLGGIIIVRKSKNKYMNHLETEYRMMYEKTLYVSEHLAAVFHKKEYIEEIFNQRIILNRFSEIQTNINEIPQRELKFDYQPLIEAYKNSYKSLSEESIKLATCLKDRGNIKEAKSYIYLAKMIYLDIEIPEYLSNLNLIEPSI